MNTIINIIVFGALLLLIFLALTNPNKVNIIANKWFGLFFFCVFIINIDSVFLLVNIVDKNNFYINIIALPAYFLAPIFYFTIEYFINPNRKWQKKDNLHFLFGIIFSAFFIFVFFILNDSSKATLEILETNIYITIFNYMFLILFPLQLIFYGFNTYKKLKKHQQNIKVFSSNTENIDLKWLENIVLAINFLIIIWVLDILLSVSTDKFGLINATLLAGIFFITYHFVKQKEIYPFDENQKNEIIKIIEEADSNDIKKKLLSEEQINQQKQELLSVMQNKKPFLDSEISLVKLATEMNCSSHQLSYLINNGFDENFYQFINRFRIEEAKKLILNPNMNHLSLLGIGFEVGFNSKSVFNTTFKKTTGKTPSEFKKNIQLVEI